MGLRGQGAWLRTSDEARKAPAGEIADKLEAALAEQAEQDKIGRLTGGKCIEALASRRGASPQWNVEQILVHIWQVVAGEGSTEQEYPYSKFRDSEGGKLLRTQLEGLASRREIGEGRLLDWLSEKVQEGKGTLVFSMTEEGHIGLFIGDSGPALGIGASALEALENAQARAALAGERADK